MGWDGLVLVFFFFFGCFWIPSFSLVLLFRKYLNGSCMINLIYTVGLSLQRLQLGTTNTTILERDYNETAFLPHNKYFGISNNNNRGI